MCVYWDTVLFCVRLMVIYKENHLKISVNRYKQNHLMIHCFGLPEGLESLVGFAENCGRSLKFCWAPIFPSVEHRAGSYQVKTPSEGW